MRRRRAGEWILDLLYPRRCPVCHGLAPAGKTICPSCMGRLPFVRGSRCRKCGKPVLKNRVFCDDCLKYPHAFDQGTAILVYDDCVRETIAYYKYKGRREYGPVLGRLLALHLTPCIKEWKIDAVIPVPLHPSRERARGYNQAAVVAAETAKRYGIPLVTDALIRTGRTTAMKTLSAGERREHLKSAFAAGSGLITKNGTAWFRTREGWKPLLAALLIDDIYTTGSTADACAAVLKEAGVRHVFTASVAIGAGAAGEE